jgi:UDP-2-acetamido-3-amino-2,3-dideoxy-glucuronate N-acetyltransferase
MVSSSTFVHESSYVDDGCVVGAGTRVWYFCHLTKGCEVGANCNIGQNVFIGADCKIGNNVKIQNNVSVYTGVELEDDVFCGPSMVFTNVVNPRSAIERKDEFRPTLVKKGATIGGNATVVCGATLGRHSFIGAGSVVTTDVPDFALVVGVPGRRIGWVCICAERLNFSQSSVGKESAKCTCGREYVLESNQVEMVPSEELDS